LFDASDVINWWLTNISLVTTVAGFEPLNLGRPFDYSNNCATPASPAVVVQLAEQPPNDPKFKGSNSAKKW
jgi:hypothetical protein